MRQEREIEYEEGVSDLNVHSELVNHRQIDQSRGLFEAMTRKTNGQIEQIRLEALRKEKERRFEEEVKRQQRVEAARSEAMQAARKTAELDMRWSEYKEMEECQELATSLEEHRRMFSGLVKKKEELVDMLQRQIKFKDEEYIAEMEIMKRDVDEIVVRMRRQFRELREQVGAELRNIETDLGRQREETIENMKVEIDDKFANHKKTEDDASEARYCFFIQSERGGRQRE